MINEDFISTNKLRWIETNDQDNSPHTIWSNWGEFTFFKLQQYWKTNDQDDGKWVDVEIEWKLINEG